MPKISIIILTKNRVGLLQKAMASVMAQTFSDFEVVVVDDGSTDETVKVLQEYKDTRIQVLNHNLSKGITASRQEALLAGRGEFVAILDDDDEWTDKDKLKKQVEFLDNHPGVVLAGGGIRAELGIMNNELRTRPQEDGQIRRTMLLRNNFFTSTVMFRREAALQAGGFIADDVDLGEDYDLWLRLGQLGQMYNFQETFAVYRQNVYNKERFREFLKKQLSLIKRHKKAYPYYIVASIILRFRLYKLI